MTAVEAQWHSEPFGLRRPVTEATGSSSGTGAFGPKKGCCKRLTDQKQYLHAADRLELDMPSLFPLHHEAR
jgi:hypothetical protein